MGLSPKDYYTFTKGLFPALLRIEKGLGGVRCVMPDSSFEMNDNCDWGNEQMYPVDQFRPFCNAEEFRRYRGRWVVKKGKRQLDASLNLHGKTLQYNDLGVTFINGSQVRFIEWATAFDQLLFDDGSPFGVKCK